jgi:hypothetical protein
MIDPEWISAGADVAAAAEKGFAMFRKPAKEAREVSPVPAAAPAPAPAMTSSGISSEALIYAALIIAAAILAAALIVHHGLVA